MGEAVVREREFHKFTHEIKNPLAICNGYLEIMMRENDRTKEKYLPIIHKEVERSLNIINEYSQNKFSTLEIEEFDLTYLLEEVVKTLNSLFLKNNSKILFSEKKEYYMKGDYNKLKQVFLNLLKNSYEAKNSESLLVVIQILPYHNYYQVAITDNGIGMTRQELQRLGEEYYTTKEYGTGLGISYCKEIILQHGGNLFYQAKKFLGTKVILTLPKEKSPKTFSNNNYWNN